MNILVGMYIKREADMSGIITKGNPYKIVRVHNGEVEVIGNRGGKHRISINYIGTKDNRWVITNIKNIVGGKLL